MVGDYAGVPDADKSVGAPRHAPSPTLTLGLRVGLEGDPAVFFGAGVDGFHGNGSLGGFAGGY